jgi:Kef-type K+ transport system membrane component KefB
MTTIELFILILLLLLSVPDLCARWGRPALLYAVYLLVGLLMGPLLQPELYQLLADIGRFGFILLLFEIGLEIDLPPVQNLRRPAVLAARWSALQIPVLLVMARWVGLSWTESVLATAALIGCSVSMTFLAWQHFPTAHQATKQLLLLWMVSVEIMAILVLTAGGALLKHGFSRAFFGQLILIALAVFLISRFADRLTHLLGGILAATSRWKIHYVVLFVLMVSACGARLGLSESKTAFFLGLFMSRATHEGLALSHHLRPLSQHLLIPIFFVSLGAFVPLDLLTTPVGGRALAAAVVLLIFRDVLHRTWSASGAVRKAFLLVCPNLTIVAIAANTMREFGSPASHVAWVVLTGLVLSLIALLLLPKPAVAPSV